MTRRFFSSNSGEGKEDQLETTTNNKNDDAPTKPILVRKKDLQPKPRVVIVGRPNVGKSTLFNRFVGQNRALVSAVPGTTRDVSVADCTWNGVEFSILDTGGILVEDDTLISKEVVREERSSNLDRSIGHHQHLYS